MQPLSSIACARARATVSPSFTNVSSACHSRLSLPVAASVLSACRHVALVATSLARDHVTCAYRCARRQRCHHSRFKNIADTSPSPYALTAEIPYYLYYSKVQYEARSEPVSLPSYRGRTGAQERLPSRGRYGHVALAKVSRCTVVRFQTRFLVTLLPRSRVALQAARPYFPHPLKGSRGPSLRVLALRIGALREIRPLGRLEPLGSQNAKSCENSLKCQRAEQDERGRC